MKYTLENTQHQLYTLNKIRDEIEHSLRNETDHSSVETLLKLSNLALTDGEEMIDVEQFSGLTPEHLNLMDDFLVELNNLHVKNWIKNQIVELIESGFELAAGLEFFRDNHWVMFQEFYRDNNHWVMSQDDFTEADRLVEDLWEIVIDDLTGGEWALEHSEEELAKAEQIVAALVSSADHLTDEDYPEDYPIELPNWQPEWSDEIISKFEEELKINKIG